MSAMTRSSIRSRLTGSAVAFLLGFGIANVGLVTVPRPDMWIWVVVGAVMMLTGVVGVLVADTRRDVSIWAILGVELFVVFTLVPLVWVLSTATTPAETTRLTLWPSSLDWSAFGEVWDSGRIRSAMATSTVVAGLATLLAMVVAVPAAYGLSHRPVRGRRWWYLAFVVALIAPTMIFAAPAAAQLLDFGWSTSRAAMAWPTLVVSLPMAVFLLVKAFLRAPWGLHDTVRAEGATLWQQIKFFAAPQLALDVALIAVMVFFWTVSDFAIGAGVAATQEAQPLSAALLDIGADPESSRLVAAAGLWCLLPLVIISALFSRRIVSLLGRS